MDIIINNFRNIRSRALELSIHSRFSASMLILHFPQGRWQYLETLWVVMTGYACAPDTLWATPQPPHQTSLDPASSGVEECGLRE